MRHKLETAIPLLALITAMIFPAAVANAQNAAPVSLQEQLSAQYKLVKVGNATGEVTIVEPGTMLSIQKGGIVGVIPKSVAICPSKRSDQRPGMIAPHDGHFPSRVTR